MNKPRKLAVLALGLTLGLAGFGPAAFANRDNGRDDDEVESCSTSQSNDSDNETGDSSQSGLINVNNIALQGLNLDVLGNLLCQGVFLNDIVAGVLGSAEGGDHDGRGRGGDAECSTSQENDSDNETGDSDQDGLVNLNNVALQGDNLDVAGNLLCGGNFLNDVVAGVLGSAEGGDSDGGRGGADGCTTEQENGSDNETGDSEQGGLANLNNIALQGSNLDVLGNALCSGNFLNGLTAAVLGSAEQGDDDDRRSRGGDAECSTEQDTDADSETGDSVMGGLLNLNNLALQGDNVAVLSNGLCGSIFLNDVLVSVLGIVG